MFTRRPILSIATLTLLIVLPLLISQAGCRSSRPLPPPVEWDGALSLPPMPGDSVNIGVAGAYAGIADGSLFVAGGANFPDGAPWTGASKMWHRTLYRLDLATGRWTLYPDFLPRPMGYGVSIQLPQGVLLIGGNNAGGRLDDVMLLTVGADDRPQLDSVSYPRLPVPLSNAAGAMVDSVIYLAGGIATTEGPESASRTFLSLDLRHPDRGWQALNPWPGPELGFSVASALDGRFYLFGGRDFGPDRELTVHPDGYAYDPATSSWTRLDGTFPVMAGTAAPIHGESDAILLFGGVDTILPTAPDHPGFPHHLYRYTPATGILDTLSTSPYPVAVTTTLVTLPTDQGTPSASTTFIIASGESRPGVRTPRLLRCTINRP